MSVMKFFRIWKRSSEMALEHVMAYKTAFFLLLLSLFLGDILIPVISVVIYQVSSGIPGWNLAEFVLFQGTLIIVIGLWHTFFASLLGETISAVEEGIFDRVLLKPFPSLAFLTAYSFDPDGLAEVAAGIIIVGWALVKMHFFNSTIIIYALILILAVLFEYSLTIIASSMAFTFVRTWRLFELINIAERFSRYPLDVYNKSMRFFLTFIVPAGIAAYYPASVLMGKQTVFVVFKIIIPILLFFVFSLWLWNISIKKYNSAGG